MSEDLGQHSWDERYRAQDSLWSGHPNRYLVSEAVDLAPGWALDAGSGEGADAIWLAEHGWQVTAVDFSVVALERAAAHARRRGADIAARIEWILEDLTTWLPEPLRFDLVTAQYLHLPSAVRAPLFARLAAAVAPGGTLLVVGHHPSDLRASVRRPPDPDRYFTGDEITSALGPAGWEIITDSVPERTAADADNRPVTVRDTVVRARRQSS
jgi:SAM-dependent methyltransferase